MAAEREVLKYELDITDVEQKSTRLDELLNKQKSLAATGGSDPALDAEISETPRKPLKGISPGQLRALAAIARRRGWDRPQLREIAGVRESLKELSVVDASKLIDHLQTEDHRAEYTPPPPDRAARGAIKMASERQRNKIAAMFAELDWPDEKSAGWLLKRHGIAGLAADVFSSKTASKAIIQLEQIQIKAWGKGGGSAA